jgi:hypothetical protein
MFATWYTAVLFLLARSAQVFNVGARGRYTMYQILIVVSL